MGTLSLLVTMGNRSVRPHASECCCVADSCYAPSARRARALDLVLKREPEGRHVSFAMLETVYQPNNKVGFQLHRHHFSLFVYPAYTALRGPPPPSFFFF